MAKWYVRKNITGVTWEQQKQASFPLEWWALGLGFFCSHWTPMMDSIYLTCPYQPWERYKTKRRTSKARRKHVDRKLAQRRSVTSLLCQNDVIMLHLSEFRIFWKSYNMRYIVVSKKKNPLFVWGWDRKIYPSRSPFVITRQASWCQSVTLGTDFSFSPSHWWWLLKFSSVAWSSAL